MNEETDPLPYDPHRSWGALFVPFLYPKAVVDRNLQFIKHADEAAEAAQAAALKVKLALKDGGIGAAVKAAPEIVHASSQTALVESGVSPTGSNGGGDSPDGGADAAALALLHEHDKKLVDGDSEFQILVALVKKTPVWCFILFVFVTNLGAYKANGAVSGQLGREWAAPLACAAHCHLSSHPPATSTLPLCRNFCSPPCRHVHRVVPHRAVPHAEPRLHGGRGRLPDRRGLRRQHGRVVPVRVRV